MNAHDAGQYGENTAAAFLQNLGYTILERNYHSRYGEIDLIAKDGDTVVFAEVKCRRDAAFAQAAEAVGPSKQTKLRKTALFWFAEHGECPARFDVIEVYTGAARQNVEVRHIPNAF